MPKCRAILQDGDRLVLLPEGETLTPDSLVYIHNIKVGVTCEKLWVQVLYKFMDLHEPDEEFKNKIFEV